MVDGSYDGSVVCLRDAQEVPSKEGMAMMKIIHSFNGSGNALATPKISSLINAFKRFDRAEADTEVDAEVPKRMIATRTTKRKTKA